MTTTKPPILLECEEALFIRDVLDLTDRYLRNRWRDPTLAPGIALAAADGARTLTRHLDQKKDH